MPKKSNRAGAAKPTHYPVHLIAQDRRNMVSRLHRSYLNLVHEMAPLQADWDAGPQAAFARAAAAGAQLGAQWRDEGAELFDAPFWQALAPIDAAPEGAPAPGTSVLATERLVGMRDQVLALPALLAGGDPVAISQQIGAILRDFDAAYGEAVVGDAKFGSILALIRHDESVLSYMAYVGLMITTVPPNFYALVAGKGAPCLMLEGVVLAVSALVSGSNATASRIWKIEERFAALEAADPDAGDALNMDDAVDAFVRMLDDFRRAASNVHSLCANIGPARRTDVVSTRMSIAEKMAAIVADTACRDCDSGSHTTAVRRMGTVSYE